MVKARAIVITKETHETISKTSSSATESVIKTVKDSKKYDDEAFKVFEHSFTRVSQAFNDASVDIIVDQVGQGLTPLIEKAKKRIRKAVYAKKQASLATVYKRQLETIFNSSVAVLIESNTKLV